MTIKLGWMSFQFLLLSEALDAGMFLQIFKLKKSQNCQYQTTVEEKNKHMKVLHSMSKFTLPCYLLVFVID
jgi:hypothetical protein